jgi:predicted secreted Zn-dependent protease
MEVSKKSRKRADPRYKRMFDRYALRIRLAEEAGDTAMVLYLREIQRELVFWARKDYSR